MGGVLDKASHANANVRSHALETVSMVSAGVSRGKPAMMMVCGGGSPGLPSPAGGLPPPLGAPAPLASIVLVACVAAAVAAMACCVVSCDSCLIFLVAVLVSRCSLPKRLFHASSCSRSLASIIFLVSAWTLSLLLLVVLSFEYFVVESSYLSVGVFHQKSAAYRRLVR